MTAEEILEKNCIGWSAGEYAIACDKAHTCMEEYARQEAIGFAEWLENHKLDFQASREAGTWIGLDLIIITTSELYTLYLNQRKP